MRRVTVRWTEDIGPEEVLGELLELSDEPGIVVVEIHGGSSRDALPRVALERLSRSRAVTVAVCTGRVGGGALELACALDLLYLRRNGLLDAGEAREVPAAAVLEAFRAAGVPALRRLLLDPRPITAEEARELGVAAGVLGADDDVPLPADASPAALTAARDLMRTSALGAAALALESAAFRLLFAGGGPQEGAHAFLEGRAPDFTGGGG